MQVAREIAERGRVKEPDLSNEFNSNVVSINYKDGIA
jgi:hypothetical protein